MNYIAYGRYEDHPSFALRGPELARPSPDQEAQQRVSGWTTPAKPRRTKKPCAGPKTRFTGTVTNTLPAFALHPLRWPGAEDFNHVLQQAAT